MNRELLDFAAAHEGIFTRKHALGFGLTRREIDRCLGSAWVAVHLGVYRIDGAPATWRGRLLAACWSAPALAGISHCSATALFELPGGRDDIVELTCVRWRRAREAGLVVHESRKLTARDLTEVDGIPVVKPEVLLMQLAWSHPRVGYLEMVVQAARRRRLITFESMQEEFARRAGRGLRGVRALRTVLEQWDPSQRATESEMETLMLRVLHEGGLPSPVPQFEIADAQGHFVARVDAALPQWRIAIEYDSKQEHSDEFQLARDARRRNQIVAAGWLHLTARHQDLARGGSELCAMISAAIQHNRRHVTPDSVVT